MDQLTQHVRLRVFHEAERPRNGRQLLMPFITHDPVAVPASEVLHSLRPPVVSPRFVPHVFLPEHDCFVSLEELDNTPIFAELEPHESNKGLPPRIDVKLVDRIPAPPPNESRAPSVDESHAPSADGPRAPLAQRLLCDSGDTSLSASWFAIGIIRGKCASNHGSLWRSALQFGAAMTFTIGKRYQKNIEGCADIYKTHRQIPCISYVDTTAFMQNAPIDAKVVVVEYGGTDLAHFQHPKRALYVLGAEDNGVPPAFVKRAHCHVSIPTAPGRPASLNVAAAAAIVLYDRFSKLYPRTSQ